MTGSETPDRSYREGHEHTINTLRQANNRLRSDLGGQPQTIQLKTLQAAAKDIHRVTVWPPSSGSSAVDLIEIPGGGMPLTAAQLAGIPDAQAASEPATAASSNLSNDPLDNVPLDQMLVSAKLSWTSFVLPGLLAATGVLGLTKFRGLIDKIGNTAARWLVKGGLWASLVTASNMIWRQFLTSPRLRIYENAVKQLPAVLHYQVTSSHRIDVYDAYANPKQRWSPEELQYLQQYLDLMPADHLKKIQAIVSAPVNTLTDDGTTGETVATPMQLFTFFQAKLKGIILMRDGLKNGLLGHEIGHFAKKDLPKDLNDQWEKLHSASRDPFFDFVDSADFSSTPSPGQSPYGSTNTDEDFASVYGNWVSNSGFPQVHKSWDLSCLAEAINRAGDGHSILLAKTLFIAGLFASPENQKISVYTHQDPWNTQTALQRNSWTYQRTANTLVIGGYTFRIENGLITGVKVDFSNDTSLPSSYLKEPYEVTFAQPAPIPPSLKPTSH
jgi:hypothetical protein